MTCRRLVALLTIVLPLGLHAAPKKQPTTSQQETSDYAVAIPKTELQLAAKTPIIDETPVTFEFAVSSWSPSGFSRPTYNDGERAFGRSQTPFVSISRIAPFGEEPTAWHSKLGLAASSLERKVSVAITGGTQEAQQDLNFFSARIGAEYRGSRLLKE